MNMNKNMNEQHMDGLYLNFSHINLFPKCMEFYNFLSEGHHTSHLPP